MNDKERLNEIIIRYKTVKPFEFYNDIGVIAMDEKDKDCWSLKYIFVGGGRIQRDKKKEVHAITE
ncbi:MULTISPECIES: hypothetical protein [unclassified Geobacillus]|uniref:hypothetical protein n=1 Tax=unclassified Geobacillus TaxID=2642459 RepID=UPI000BE48535|nr:MULTISPECIES: hypothetical protein [unclassified Geobacillus]PDM40394.1 hypothetical protein CN643_07885 [Parageobacillus yumthangensis]RDV20983.1 hypothetical protein DXK91_16810 [Parageobacillus toebii]TXK92228.1 hypothetical protein FVE24_01895 [Parageobacillus sp. SY1]PUF89047.1 hypothetical protein DCC82_08360 [Geobacillus sp. LYN3]TXK87112.1 hypothetical protein FVE68_11230 [Geobacillus sp. AYS3]